MKKSRVFLISSIFILIVILTGCGDDKESTPQKKPNEINIKGIVYDALVPFAKVQLILFSSGIELVKLTADANGKWDCTINKNKIPANSFIIIFATNPVNGAILRSVIDTDDVLTTTNVYKANETIVSHYTEAAVVLAEVEGGLDQEKYDAMKKLIKIENDEPVATGLQDIDELADTIQINFDDNTSSQDKLTLAVYKELLEREVSASVPDEHGVVSVSLPVAYSDEVVVDINLSIQTFITKNSDNFTFVLTPQQSQHDINITVSATLHNESIIKTLTLYALGNSKAHYRYKAVAPAPEPIANIKSIMINGCYYTLIPYSFVFVDESNANISTIDINGTLRNRSFGMLKIADNYAGTKVLVKVYEGKDIFDTTTLVGDTNITTLGSNSINIGNIELTRVDDFRPLQPTDINIAMPPVAPKF